jgi:hypothetical protein
MSLDRIRKTVADARSTDDLVDDDPFGPAWPEEKLDSPLDRETLDEQASTQMGEMWEPRRRGAN